MMSNQNRLQALSEFLKARRAAITPAAAGPPGGHLQADARAPARGSGAALGSKQHLVYLAGARAGY